MSDNDLSSSSHFEEENKQMGGGYNEDRMEGEQYDLNSINNNNE